VARIVGKRTRAGACGVVRGPSDVDETASD
jgi:hypothetical protein